jgi:2-oxoisovalerate dehydrogenase E1 component beta subunit
VREGADISVVAYGAMVHAALEAADAIGDASVEVVDVRSLVPLDLETILASVRKTSKALVIDEANATCAAGAQIAWAISNEAFEDLDGPVRRLATPDVPIPFSPPLERAVLPTVDSITEAIRELLEY